MKRAAALIAGKEFDGAVEALRGFVSGFLAEHDHMIERDPVPILSQMVAFGMVAQFKHDQEST